MYPGGAHPAATFYKDETYDIVSCMNHGNFLLGTSGFPVVGNVGC
jgi:hypothetical protein